MSGVTMTAQLNTVPAPGRRPLKNNLFTSFSKTMQPNVTKKFKEDTALNVICVGN